jgi:rubrerythrin
MSITFNADEIFEMAEEIERNAGKFYRKAAGIASDKATKKLLLDLAEMEDNHLGIFQSMRRKLGAQEKEQTAFDPDNEALLYLQAMADTHGAEGKISPTQELTGKETMQEIFKIALNAEKDSVFFYFGMRSFVPEKNSRDKVEKIINEEIGHITVLHQKLLALK